MHVYQLLFRHVDVVCLQSLTCCGQVLVVKESFDSIGLSPSRPWARVLQYCHDRHAAACVCRGGPQSALMFCTNGVLLRMLTHGRGLGGLTHILVDEIHERDCYADFLLILLRQALPAYPHLRIVLMSATLHVDLFAGYFGGCRIVQVACCTLFALILRHMPYSYSLDARCHLCRS